MRKDIEHFADAIRDYGLGPQPLHGRGLAGAVGLLAAGRALTSSCPGRRGALRRVAARVPG